MDELRADHLGAPPRPKALMVREGLQSAYQAKAGTGPRIKPEREWILNPTNPSARAATSDLAQFTPEAQKGRRPRT